LIEFRFGGHFPDEPELVGCPLNSPSPFIPKLRILLRRLRSPCHP